MKIAKSQLRQIIKEELNLVYEQEKHFDADTGLPITDKGRKMCANNPGCAKRAEEAGVSLETEDELRKKQQQDLDRLQADEDERQAQQKRGAGGQMNDQVAAAVKQLDSKIDELEGDFLDHRKQVFKILKKLKGAKAGG